mmetsp:Transcript_29575/g.64278  ORF Transcript_29575/g.64278 Transcript_29575/m.64278 type:complete len:219 (+) Transcript_29575:395-1051(+)
MGSCVLLNAALGVAPAESSALSREVAPSPCSVLTATGAHSSATTSRKTSGPQSSSRDMQSSSTPLSRLEISTSSSEQTSEAAFDSSLAGPSTKSWYLPPGSEPCSPAALGFEAAMLLGGEAPLETAGLACASTCSSRRSSCPLSRSPAAIVWSMCCLRLWRDSSTWSFTACRTSLRMTSTILGETSSAVEALQLTWDGLGCSSRRALLCSSRATRTCS